MNSITLLLCVFAFVAGAGCNEWINGINCDNGYLYRAYEKELGSAADLLASEEQALRFCQKGIK